MDNNYNTPLMGEIKAYIVDNQINIKSQKQLIDFFSEYDFSQSEKYLFSKVIKQSEFSNAGACMVVLYAPDTQTIHYTSFHIYNGQVPYQIPDEIQNSYVLNIEPIFKYTKELEKKFQRPTFIPKAKRKPGRAPKNTNVNEPNVLAA